MNKFELYCMIFYVLDAEWNDTHDERLGDFLSSANPFLFKDIGSAVPDIYNEFVKIIPDKITAEDSFDIAKNYIESLNADYIKKAFFVNKEDWDEALADYLSSPHKN